MMLLLFYFFNSLVILANSALLTISLIVYDNLHQVLHLTYSNLLFLIFIAILGIVSATLGIHSSKKCNKMFVIGSIVFLNSVLLMLLRVDDFMKYINKWIQIKYKILNHTNQTYVKEKLGCCEGEKCEVECFNIIEKLFNKFNGIFRKVMLFLFILSSLSLIMYLNKLV